MWNSLMFKLSVVHNAMPALGVFAGRIVICVLYLIIILYSKRILDKAFITPAIEPTNFRVVFIRESRRRL